MRHARSPSKLSTTKPHPICIFTQNKSDKFDKTGCYIHAVSMPNGKLHKQDQLTSLANWHSFVPMKTMPIGIAAVIKSTAKERGLSMAELASRTQLSYDSVLRKVSRQTRSISVDELQAFAAALDVPASELVKRTEDTGKRGARADQIARALAVPDDSSDGYAIQDAASGSIILQACRVDWDGGDEE